MLVLGAAAAALLAFYHSREADAAATVAPTTAPLAVRTEPAEWVDGYARRRVYTGRVAARRTVELGFERLGRLVVIRVDDGQRVEDGQVLAELDRRELTLQRRETEALRRQAGALMEELRSGPRKQTIEAARRQVEDLRAQLELSRLKRARSKQLLQRGTIGAEAFDEADYASRALAARFAAAEERLEELLEGTRPERLDAQAALVAQLDTKLESIDLQLEKSLLRAPFAGRIGARWVDEGKVVTAREAVLRLVESDKLEARVGLPARVAAKLAAGASYKVVVDGQAVAGTVRQALPGIDAASRTRTVVLDLAESAAERVVPGQIARVEIAETVRARGLWLANTALVKSARGLWSVYVVRERVVEKREVELIHAQGERVLVRGTLAANERVISAGTHRVVPGQRVIED